jgi:hypothetical protein
MSTFRDRWLTEVCRRSLRQSVKAVAVALWMHADNDHGGDIHAGTPVLMVASSSSSPKTVRAALNELIGEGLLEKTGESKAIGEACTYRLLVPRSSRAVRDAYEAAVEETRRGLHGRPTRKTDTNASGEAVTSTGGTNPQVASRASHPPRQSPVTDARDRPARPRRRPAPMPVSPVTDTPHLQRTSRERTDQQHDDLWVPGWDSDPDDHTAAPLPVDARPSKSGTDEEEVDGWPPTRTPGSIAAWESA